MKTIEDLKTKGIEPDNIYQCDCVEGMKYIKDKTVDLVLCDPPYGLEWKETIHIKGRKSMYHHKEDTEEWDNGFDVKEFYDTLFATFNRIVKPEGSVVLFTRAEYISYAVESCLRNGFHNKASICWHKTNPVTQVRKKNYLSSIEMILWVARYSEEGCPFTFNFGLQSQMHNFIEGSICMGDERTEHPTQKPLYVLEPLVRNHSNIGDLVLDPFVGSGSVAVACKKLGRRFIGMELEQKYVDLADGRLSRTAFQHDMFEGA